MHMVLYPGQEFILTTLEVRSFSCGEGNFFHGKLNRVEGPSFYHPKPPTCLVLLLTARVLSQHFVTHYPQIRYSLGCPMCETVR